MIDLFDPQQTASDFAAWAGTPLGFVLQLDLNTEPLAAAFEDMLSDAWMAGYHTADLEIVAQGQTPKPPPWRPQVEAAAVPDDGLDWSTWEPGWQRGALKLIAQDGSSGLAQLLAGAGITIRGIADTTLADLGDALGEAVEQGLGVEQTARSIRPIIEDRKRAQMIAQTEVARAMTSASLDSYFENGIEQTEWLLSTGACPLCVENEAASPVDIHAPWPNGHPPVHPHCVCALAPVVTRGQE